MKPILFNGEMVRAILDKRKTQTRRVVKWPVISRSDGCRQRVYTDTDEINEVVRERQRAPLRRGLCPYGAVGDKLWVRETWTLGDTDTETWAEIHYRADDACVRHECAQEQAQGHAELLGRLEAVGDGGDNWRPSIHMPRWASRITLEITDVRVQRVQEIAEDDARAEGATPVDVATNKWGYPQSFKFKAGFAALWDSINSARGFGWDANPWVWAITFRRVQE